MCPLGRMTQRKQSRLGETSGAGEPGESQIQKRRDGKLLKKVLKQDALYLMVVNLPTREEMDRVMALYEGQT